MVRRSGRTMRDTWLHDVLASVPRKLPSSTNFPSASHQESKRLNPASSKVDRQSGSVNDVIGMGRGRCGVAGVGAGVGFPSDESATQAIRNQAGGLTAGGRTRRGRGRAPPRGRTLEGTPADHADSLPATGGEAVDSRRQITPIDADVSVG